VSLLFAYRGAHPDMWHALPPSLSPSLPPSLPPSLQPSLASPPVVGPGGPTDFLPTGRRLGS
jgi:hypothetical protein